MTCGVLSSDKYGERREPFLKLLGFWYFLFYDRSRVKLEHYYTDGACVPEPGIEWLVLSPLRSSEARVLFADVLTEGVPTKMVCARHFL